MRMLVWVVLCASVLAPAALRASGAGGPVKAEVARPALVGSPEVVATQQPRLVAQEQENLFWQSIMDSTNPAEFEAYLEQFPDGIFRALALARLESLRASMSDVSAGATDPGLGAGAVFRDCDRCPEMVVMPRGRLALGRYEVTVDEYRAFVLATDAGAPNCYGNSWRDPGFRQTDRHPVVCVSWHDAESYVHWLSRMSGAEYRLPSGAEWGRAAAGALRGCDRERTGNRGTCPVGSHGSTDADTGLADMVGNVWEWTADCWEGDCDRRVGRGGAWSSEAEYLHPGARGRYRAGYRDGHLGFRVARTLD